MPDILLAPHPLRLHLDGGKTPIETMIIENLTKITAKERTSAVKFEVEVSERL